MKVGLSIWVASTLYLLSSAESTLASQWAKYYADAERNYRVLTAQQTKDGGFVVAGNSSLPGQLPDAWIMRLDSDGTALWQRTYGGSGTDIFIAIRQTEDEGYIIAGQTDSFGAGGIDIWAMKLDSQGEMGTVGWQQTYGTTGREQASAILEIPGDGYVLAGEQDSSAWLLKLSTSGGIIWQRKFTASSANALSLNSTSDGGYLVAGFASENRGDADGLVMKIDGAGDVIWHKTYGGNDQQVFTSTLTVPDGLVVAGMTRTPGSDNDMWVLKLDSTGTLAASGWQKKYGGLGSDWPTSVLATKDGGFLLAGVTASYGAGRNDVWLLKLDKDGETTVSGWQRAYGTAGIEEFGSFQETKDGGYIIAATASVGAFRVPWVLKTDANGNIAGCTGILTTSAVPAVTTFSATVVPINQVETVVIPQPMQIAGAGSVPSEQTVCYQPDPRASLLLTPSEIRLGDVDLGKTSGAILSLSNVGNIDLSVQRIALTGTDTRSFQYGSGGNDPCLTFPPTISPSESCSIEIRCLPSSLGAKFAQLEFTSNDSDSHVSVVRLQCVGVSGSLSVSPLSHDYGELNLKSRSLLQSFTLTNTGNGSLTVVGEAIVGSGKDSFTLTRNRNDACPDMPNIMQPGQSCSVDIAFEPKTEEPISAMLWILASDPTAAPREISLHGTGTNRIPDITISKLIGPSSACQGSDIVVDNTVANIAVIVSAAMNVSFASGSTRVNFYLWDRLAGVNVYLGSRVVPYLSANTSFPYKGESDQASTVLTVPSDLRSGRYYLTAVLDPEDNIYEANERNNQTSYGPIEVGGPSCQVE